MNKNEEALTELEKTTLLLNYYGDGKRNRYIYGIINEVKRRILNEGNYDKLKLREPITSLKGSDIVYEKGKVTLSKQKDFKMNELLKCTYQKEFEQKND